MQSLPRTDQFGVAEKLEQLCRNPDDSSLDIKKLEGEPYFRLRVGNWRVIFEWHDAVRIILPLRKSNRVEMHTNDTAKNKIYSR